MAQFDTIRSAAGARSAEIDAGLRAHMNKVYGTMSVGTLITFVAAWAIAGLAVTSDPSGAVAQISNDTYLTQFGYSIYASPLKWVIMFAPLAFIFFGFGAAMKRLSAAGVQLAFYVFATLMGLSISSIFLVYTDTSIAQVFLVTSIAFAGLSLWGYTTKKDISGWGSFLIMGVWGLLAASLLNFVLPMFIQGYDPSAMRFGISLLGVLIFAGLTAYDTQKIKTTYLQMAHSGDQEFLGKAAIMGALSLYLDFINMFMFLLQLLGNRE
ncbi:Bax inhibitor-1/YccA family protein [Phaeobacter sp. HF9A]|uniref:Bax inhibitor-1/YccA family protein n=1 Tax=Phaeobacter sp. HF9A TaxID=2721561 RepID=UPI00142FE358|nr:Bax inhibitor-1/YccA family protein [Phaeobacter sp. HF9A]NIZ15270.1 Bax inhibitor-1/YccA family protein [Phaeobacter sp. HF9A]